MLRHFEQRTVLAEAGQGVQLLVKRKMIALHGILEGLLRRLARLAEQRRLSDGSRDGAGDELFEAAWLLGQLTQHLYEEADDGGGGGKSMAATAVLSTTDHTRGIYVIPIAKAIGRLGSDTLAFAPLEAEEKPVAEHVQHDRLPCSYHTRKANRSHSPAPSMRRRMRMTYQCSRSLCWRRSKPVAGVARRRLWKSTSSAPRSSLRGGTLMPLPCSLKKPSSAPEAQALLSGQLSRVIS